MKRHSDLLEAVRELSDAARALYDRSEVRRIADLLDRIGERDAAIAAIDAETLLALDENGYEVPEALVARWLWVTGCPDRRVLDLAIELLGPEPDHPTLERAVACFAPTPVRFRDLAGWALSRLRLLGHQEAVLRWIEGRPPRFPQEAPDILEFARCVEALAVQRALQERREVALAALKEASALETHTAEGTVIRIWLRVLDWE